MSQFKIAGDGGSLPFPTPPLLAGYFYGSRFGNRPIYRQRSICKRRPPIPEGRLRNFEPHAYNRSFQHRSDPRLLFDTAVTKSLVSKNVWDRKAGI
jgi:hypothetical protein